MQRRKKQLLGLVGLALIAAITAIAFAIPNPEASAAGETAERGVGVTVKVEEQVPSELISATLITPQDKDIVVGSDLEIEFSYKNANGADVTLTRYNSDGSETTVTIPVDVEGCMMKDSDGSGICKLTYPLGDYPISDKPLENDSVKYRVMVVPKLGGKSGTEDKADIFYRPATIQYTGKNESSTGNPHVEIKLNGAVAGAKVQVYDANGKWIFGNGDTETPLELTPEQIAQAKAGGLDLVLDLKKYGLKAGNYKVVLAAFNNAGKVMGLATDNVVYTPNGGGTPVDPDDPNNPDNPNNPNNPDEPGGVTPDVPGTGSIFRDLNISRADYLIVGLLAFGLVTGFAVFLIVRRNKR